jgi:hypothetical protein
MKVSSLNQFQITSRLNAASRSFVDEFARDPRLIKMGWNRQKLIRLTHILRTILRNIERITKKRMGLKFIIEKASKKNAFSWIIDEDQKKIYLSINSGPEEFLGNILPVILKLDMGDDKSKAQISTGLETLALFYANERNMQLKHPDTLRRLFSNLATRLKGETLRRKLLIFLDPKSLSKTKIESEIETTISEAREKVSRIALYEREVSIWGIIADLALLYTVAMENGYADVAQHCVNALSIDIGQHLACIMLLELGFSRVPYLIDHPLETMRQIQVGISESKLLFSIFQKIAEYHYKRMKIW